MTQPASKPLDSSPEGDARKIVLHVGWMSATPGRVERQFPAAQWREIRFDCDARVNPDIVGTPDRLEGIADASVDVVLMPQMLQRYPLPKVSAILREALRVLKDGGRAVFSVPNAMLAATYVANNLPFHTLYETKLGPITPMDLLYGLRTGVARGEEHFQHRSGYTFEQLGLLMRDNGFTNILVNRAGYEITASGFKFPYDHPERVERISMGPPSDVETGKPPKAPISDVPPNSKPLVGPNGRADELDLPPGIWKPLGLKKPKQ